MDHPISELLKLSVESITNVIDVDVIIGNPIKLEKTTLIPISKIKCGFISGGLDQKANDEYINKTPFGGGAGAHATITPIAFLVESENTVKLLHLDEGAHKFDTIIDMAKSVVEKLNFEKNN